MLRRIVSWLVYLLAWVTVCIHVQAQSECFTGCPLLDLCTEQGANIGKWKCAWSQRASAVLLWTCY